MLRRSAGRLTIYFFVILATTALRAQESKPQAPTTSAYKLEYVFSEMQNDKRINARSYTLLIRAVDKGIIKMGSRVPIFVGGSKEGGNQIQYLDIGVNIDCRIRQELDSGIALTTNLDTSSLAPEQPGENRTGDPVIRQVRYQVDNIIPLGRQTTIGSIDEVDATGRLQIDVTATKVR